MENSDPSSISPSAYTLLFMKRHTEIPYIREAAALVENKLRQAETAGAGPTFIPQFSTDPAGYGIFLLHFEDRYWSIDQLMADLPITNILELSSGFSFRGLDLSRRKPVYYIDTDLPGLIAVKQSLVNALLTAKPGPAEPVSGTAATPSAATPLPSPGSTIPPAATPDPAPRHHRPQNLAVPAPDPF